MKTTSSSYLNNISITVLSLLILSSIYTLNAQINCNLVQGYGNAEKESILEQVNRNMAGVVYNNVGATKLKKLVIKEARNITFTGCRITLELKVKLKRKLRRDASGTIIVSGYVSKAQFYGNKHIFIKNASIDKVRLSNTLRIGEKFYRWVADKTFPSNQRFSL
jgi:hypothetical protein